VGFKEDQMKWSRPVSISIALLTLTLLVVAASAAGLTPLQKAIQKGDIKKVTELLNKGLILMNGTLARL